MDNNKKDSVNGNEVSPQIENGHIDIANELVEALAKTQLSGYESRVIWALWRQTWGYALRDKNGRYIKDKKTGWVLKKKTANISSQKWCELTNMTKSHVSDTLRKLRLRRIVVPEIGNENGWGFQKVYSQWLQPIVRIVPEIGNTYFVTKNGNTFAEIGNTLTEIGNKNLPKGLFDKLFPDTKKLFKENNKERKIISTKNLNKNSIPFQLAILLDGKIRENNKRVKKRTDTQLKKWAEDIEKLIRIDKAPPEEISQVIDWVVKDNFWSPNILSANKLREHYPKLYKKVIDRGRSLKENLENDHRFDDLK